ncbi:MAG: hypothetical protein ACHQU1_12515 [Gemmatimonadales bacterium]
MMLVFGAAGQVARAQVPGAAATAPRARLARADSMWAEILPRDSLRRGHVDLARRASRFDAGPLTVLLPASVGMETGRRVASGAKGYLDGTIPPEFVGSRVVVALAATGVDSLVRAAQLSSRARVMVDVGAQPDSLADGWAVAAALANDYRATLDTSWREWLPPAAALGWTLRRDGLAAVQELMRGDTRSGADCLAGVVAACRVWLRLDPDTDAYTARYRLADLRRQIVGRWFTSAAWRTLAQVCTAGSDESCLRLASLGLVPAIPAGFSPRGSVLAFVRAQQPPGTIARALADTGGSVGDRLARVGGVPEDSLVTAWRIWLLTGGGQRRVTADLGDALPVALFGGLLLLAAARSGRWR